MTWITIIQFVVPAILVLIGVLYTQRQLAKASQRTSEVESSKVDGAAYERARLFDSGVVDRIQRELDRATSEINSLRETLNRERQEHEIEARSLRAHIDRLENSVSRLARQLRDAGIDIDAGPITGLAET